MIESSDEEGETSIEFVSKSEATSESKQIARLNRKVANLEQQIRQKNKSDVKKKGNTEHVSSDPIVNRATTSTNAIQVSATIPVAAACLNPAEPVMAEQDFNDSFIERTVEALQDDDTFENFKKLITE